jgi:Clp amino terminal domain, pathogenicity island component
MFERYTERARRTIFFARYEASMFGSQYIESEHFLLGLLREESFLRERIPIESTRKTIEARVSMKERLTTSVDLPLSLEMKRILSHGAEESQRLGHREIGCLHLALGIFREENSIAAQVLREQDFKRETIEAHLFARSPHQPSVPPPIGPLAEPLALLVLASRGRLEAIAGDEASHKLAGRDWTRSQALGHLIDLATAHHQLFARALIEPSVNSGSLPAPECAAAQYYGLLPWLQLTDLWCRLNKLLVHVLSIVPVERWKTPCRLGGSPEIPLSDLVERYVHRQTEILEEILNARSGSDSGIR